MNRSIGIVENQLEVDEISPATVAGNADAEKQFIRSVMYLTAKQVVRGILPRGVGAAYVADYIRDQHDNKVVSLAAPRISNITSTREAIELINRLFLDSIF